jgi:hypothetical protein
MPADHTECSRPTDYSDQIGTEICERIVEDEGLRAICADPTMPDKATLFDWLARHQEFRDAYAAARKFQADGLYADIFDVVDDASGDRVERVRSDGRVVVVFDRNNLARSRLRADVREWVASRLVPAKVS